MSGGSLVFSESNFALAAKLTIASFRTWQGQGESTVLTLDADVNDDIIANLDQTNGNVAIVVRDMKLAGRKASQTAGSGIDFVKVSRFRIVNVRVESAKEYGILLDACFVGELLKTQCLTCGQDGLRVQTLANQIVGDKIVCSNNDVYGINWVGTSSGCALYAPVCENNYDTINIGTQIRLYNMKRAFILDAPYVESSTENARLVQTILDCKGLNIRGGYVNGNDVARCGYYNESTEVVFDNVLVKINM